MSRRGLSRGLLIVTLALAAWVLAPVLLWRPIPVPAGVPLDPLPRVRGVVHVHSPLSDGSGAALAAAVGEKRHRTSGSRLKASGGAAPHARRPRVRAAAVKVREAAALARGGLAGAKQPRRPHRGEDRWRHEPGRGEHQPQVVVGAVHEQFLPLERLEQRRDFQRGEGVDQHIHAAEADLLQAQFFRIRVQAVGFRVEADPVRFS